MNFLELAKKRCSIRQYADTPIEPEKLDYILESMRMAPSAVNFQPWCFILVQSEKGKEKIRSCYSRDWFKQAPCYLIGCGNHAQSWKRGDNKDHADVDVSIAAEHVCLAAAEQGIGTCWVCNFDTIRCKELFNLPEEVEPVVLIPMGYPAKEDLFERTPKKRKPLEEIIIRESF